MSQRITRDERGRLLFERSIDSVSSPKVNGKLKLRPNPHYARTVRCSYQDHPDARIDSFESGFIPNMFGELYVDSASAYNRAYGSLHSHIRDKEADASLGVTLVTWKQSSQMISKRLGQVNQALRGFTKPKHALDLYHDMKKQYAPGYAGGGIANAASNDHLEYIFGWKPLISDIKGSFAALAAPIPSGFVTGRGRSYSHTTTSSRSGNITRTYVKEDLLRVSLSAHVEVSNPNLWLLNRLGLLNPAPALWDVIPWSFVVGMFVNVNTMLKSLSATAGLTVKDISTTYSNVGNIRAEAAYENWEYQQFFKGTAFTTYRTKYRQLSGTIPSPRWEVRVPDLSLETLIMASALTVQQLTRVSKLLPKRLR